MLHNPQLAK